MKNLIKNNWHSLLLILTAVTWAFGEASGLPDLIPSHFDINGRPDNFGSKYFNLSLIPFVNLFTIVLLNFRAKISPKGFEMQNGQEVIRTLNLGITFFLMSIYAGVLLEAKNPNQEYFAKILSPALGLLMVFIGNYFGKLERNFFVGIRLPWTLASEVNWKKTHRFAGKVFVLLGLISVLLITTRFPIWTGFVLLILAIALSVLYSLFYFFKYEQRSAN